MTEQELANNVLLYLHREGMDDTYQEVQLSCGGRADIVVRIGKQLWCIEVKTSMSLKLLSQAYERILHFHYVSVAVPWSAARTDFVDAVAKSFGFGVITSRGMTREILAPRFNRHALSNGIVLVQAQNEMGVAGSQHDYWSPWKQTCANLLRHVTEHEGCCLKDAIDSIKHHYSNPNRARSNMSIWLRKQMVKGIECRREGRYLRLYATTTSNDSLPKEVASEPRLFGAN